MRGGAGVVPPALGLEPPRRAPGAGHELAELALDGAVRRGPHPVLPEAAGEVLEDGPLETIAAKRPAEVARVHGLHHAVGVRPDPQALPPLAHYIQRVLVLEVETVTVPPQLRVPGGT